MYIIIINVLHYGAIECEAIRVGVLTARMIASRKELRSTRSTAAGVDGINWLLQTTYQFDLLICSLQYHAKEPHRSNS